MKLSVLVTFYNQEDYVNHALESVFMQKVNFDFEVLIGEDSSSDRTMEKLLIWKEKYPNNITVYTMPREKDVKYTSDVRASRNRLNLLKYVKGEYFIFLDGDDFYNDDNKLQKQVYILDDPRNADCAACAHNVYENDISSGKSKPINDVTIKEQKISPKKYWNKFYFHPDSIMMRSRLISSFPLEMLDYVFNDNMITYNVIQFGKIYYLPSIMATYQMTGNGIWSGRSVTVGCIRCLMMYDLERRINPNMKFQSYSRHLPDFRYLYKHKMELTDNPQLNTYYNIAKEIGATETIRYLNYNNSSFFKRLWFDMEGIFVPLIISFFRRLIRFGSWTKRLIS